MNHTLKNIIYVLIASTFAKILGGIATLIIPKILEPANYGVLATLLLILSYAPIAALGTVEALLKQYPYFIGNGQLVKARECEDNILGSICLSAIFLFICAVLVPVVISFSGLEGYQTEIQLMLLTASVSSFSGFFYFRLAAHQNFKACGKVDALRAIMMLLLIFIFARIWGLKGAVVGYFVIEILVCTTSMLLGFKICGKLRIKLNSNLIWQAIKIGFPITIIWWTLTFQSSVDRLVSASFLGKEMTGHYCLGLSFCSMLGLIPGAISRVLYPKITEGIGKNMNPEQLSSLVISPVRTLSMVIPAFIGGLIIILPTIYSSIFPKYYPGLYSAQLLLLGFFFSGLTGGANFLIAKDKQNILFVFILIGLAANAVFGLCFIYIGLGIEGVAVSTSLAGALLTTLIWRLVLKNMLHTSVNQWRLLLGLYSPFVLMLALLSLFQIIFPMFLHSTGGVSIIYIFLFLLSYLAIAFLLPPYKKWSKEIYSLFKYHISGTIKPESI
ncbi:MAG: oligosaccharide flippase family protein [Pseudomonadota bacterium]